MERKFKGGARVGWWVASWPLAELRVDDGVLELSVPFGGTHRFRPEDVIRIEERLHVIRVEHVRADVAELVLFSSGRPRRILEAIEESGFAPSACESDRPMERPFPFRPGFLLVAALVWFGLILWDLSSGWLSERMAWGPGVFVAVVLLFAGSVLIRRWGALQRLVLTGPDAVTRIEPQRRFAVLVSGAGIVAGGLMALAGL